MPTLPATRALIAGSLLTLAFGLVVSALFLWLAPTLTGHLARAVTAHPGRTILAGLGSLALLFGALPVAALTVIGLPLLLLVVLASRRPCC